MKRLTTQLVKHIDQSDCVESRALDEALVPGTPINGNRFALEDAATATQTILVYVRKAIDKLVAIGHEASLLNEQIHLLPKDKLGPYILHGHSKICTQKEGPPVCVFDRTEARRVYWRFNTTLHCSLKRSARTKEFNHAQLPTGNQATWHIRETQRTINAGKTDIARAIGARL